jgi:hypothetical protein
VSRRIPLEAVRLYVRARHLEAEGVGPPNSPMGTEYSEVRNALRRLLNRPPWTAHPLDADDGSNPPNGAVGWSRRGRTAPAARGSLPVTS